MTQSTVSQWESGNVYPVGERMRIVAEVYGCSIDELFQTEEKPA